MVGIRAHDTRTIEQRIAEIAWDRLFHAYGDGTDTAAHLTVLAQIVPENPDHVEAAHAAATHLGSAVVHQSTVWTASPAALELALLILQQRDVPADVAVRVLAAVEEASDVQEWDLPDAEPTLSARADAFLATTVPSQSDAVDDFFEQLFGDSELADELMVHAAWKVRELAPLVRQTLDALATRPELAKAVAACRLAWEA